MVDTTEKMFLSNEKEFFAVTVKEAPGGFVVNESEVLGKLAPEVTECCETDGCLAVKTGVWFEPPPDYFENDPLQGQCEVPIPDEEVVSTSDDSFWDEDDSESDITETAKNWSDLDCTERLERVFIQWVGKFVALLLLLYIFICSLDFLSSAFRILGGKTAGGVFSNSELLRNPVAGLMIGILATVLVQSSSTSTSIIVTMVGSGIIDVQPAIPLIMGANIGTSVTNTFVSMAQSGNRREFRRAFAGATVHDMFNWLTVLVLLPLEAATGYLYQLTSVIIKSSKLESFKGGKQEMLKAVTKPFTKLIIQVDKKVISKIAEGETSYMNKSLIKKYCVFDEVEKIVNVTEIKNVTEEINGTMVSRMEMVTEMTTVTEKIGKERCPTLFSQFDIGDNIAGVLLLITSLFILCTCLVLMVKLLHSLLRGSIAKVIKKTLNSDFPGCFGFLTGYVAMLVGAIMTLLVQSSSVFTSALTPLVGIGLVKLERMYPLTLGSNIGTTGTGILAAMAASGDKLPIALQIALCHLFFNISGIILFYPIPHLRKLPVNLAKKLGTITSKYRWFAIVYLALMFFLLPTIVFLVSLAGFIVSICVGLLVCFLVFVVIVVNIMQSKCSRRLPRVLRTWDFLPKPLHSLQPYDSIIMKIISGFKKCCPCCVKCCTPKAKPQNKLHFIDKNLRSLVQTGSPIVRRSPSSTPGASVASSALLLSNSIV